LSELRRLRGYVSTEDPVRWLVVRVGSQLGALPLDHVVETMRPQPVHSVAGVPGFILGLTSIRGMPTPVVDAVSVLGAVARPSSEKRFVTLRTANRRIALAVDQVLGVREIHSRQLADLPPLLAGIHAQVVSAIAMLDGELLMVLHAGKLVPEDTWAAMAAGEP
jgi:purine-binding chemotaxis protein CheW